MTKISNFPEKMHLAFGELVATEITRQAQIKKFHVDDYIHTLYRGEDDPVCFSDAESLESLYEQYKELIENAVETVNLGSVMSTTNKTYLCYRLYLHAMSINSHGLDEKEARSNLLKALRNYYESRGSRFSLDHEMALMDLIDTLSR